MDVWISKSSSGFSSGDFKMRYDLMKDTTTPKNWFNTADKWIIATINDCHSNQPAFKIF